MLFWGRGDHCTRKFRLRNSYCSWAVSCESHGGGGRKGSGSQCDTFSECLSGNGQRPLQGLGFGSLLLTFSSPSPLSYICPGPLCKASSTLNALWVLPSSLGSLCGAVSIALILSTSFSSRGSLSKKRSDGLIHELTRVQLLPFPLHLAKFLAFKS